MRTLNLSGFKLADSLTLSVSQNALTAGPVNVPAWGGGGAGGTITINVHRSALHVAPSSVRFSVDLSMSNFDTPGPIGGATYDARLHDLIYLWDFDDPGTWSAPVQNLAEHKNRNAGKGPIEANMYRTPGIHSPSVLVIEPSSGKTATASVNVTVTDPDVVFAGTKTICINPAGDGDFAGAPAGAVHAQVDLLNTTHTAWTGHLSTSEARRWLFKGGETHSVNINLGVYAEAGAYFGSYGTGKAKLQTERRATPNDVNVDNQCFSSNWATKKDTQYWFVDLEGAGNYNPEGAYPAWAGMDQTFVRFKDIGYITISDCYFHNFTSAAVYLSSPASSYITGYASGTQVLHMDNSIIENSGGGSYVTFQALGSAQENAWWVVSGSRINMHPGTWDQDIIRGTMRINDSMRQIVKGCDIFCTESTQPGIKFAETPLAHGVIANCHSNVVESQLVGITVNNNSGQSLTKNIMQINAIIDGNVICAGHSSQNGVKSFATGITVRNNLFYVPDGAFNTLGGIRFSSMVKFKGTGSGIPAEILSAPSKIYNNTLRNDRTAANNGGEPYGPPVELDLGEYVPSDPPITLNNNIIHQPFTLTPQVTFAPLSSTAVFTPRSTGWVNGRGTGGEPLGTAHPEYAPLTSVKDTRPLPGSSALGAALSGNVSYMDILMQERPEPPSKGAWEAD